MIRDATPSAPPGWYADPWDSSQQRYWTGTRWTADVFPADLNPPGREAIADDLGPTPTHPAATPPPPPGWEFRLPMAPPTTLLAAPPDPDNSYVGGHFSRRLLVIASLVVLALILTAAGLSRLRGSGTTPTAALGPSATARPSPPGQSSPTPEKTNPGQPSPGSPAPGSPAPGSPAPSSPAPGGNTIQATLAALVLHQRDVPDRFKVAPIPLGTSVLGPTLDLCNATYPSEDLRVGRLQVAAHDHSDESRLSTEAVQYQSTDATQQAFAEVRQVAAGCKTDVTLDLLTGSVTRRSITANADRSWGHTPGVDRLAYKVTETEEKTGKQQSTLAVYLRRGPLFLGVYFPKASGRQIPVEGHTSIPAIVKVFEKRLLDTPPGAPGGDSGGESGEGGGGGGIGA